MAATPRSAALKVSKVNPGPVTELTTVEGSVIPAALLKTVLQWRPPGVDVPGMLTYVSVQVTCIKGERTVLFVLPMKNISKTIMSRLHSFEADLMSL